MGCLDNIPWNKHSSGRVQLVRLLCFGNVGRHFSYAMSVIGVAEELVRWLQCGVVGIAPRARFHDLLKCV